MTMRAADLILPSQLLPGRTLTPVQSLLHALLESAINDYRFYHALPLPSAQKIATDAWDWLQSDAVSYGSFAFCCQHLGLDPAYLRRGIDALAQTPGRFSLAGSRHPIRKRGPLYRRTKAETDALMHAVKRLRKEHRPWVQIAEVTKLSKSHLQYLVRRRKAA